MVCRLAWAEYQETRGKVVIILSKHTKAKHTKGLSWDDDNGVGKAFILASKA